jgi:S1-C subfamily serine protease
MTRATRRNALLIASAVATLSLFPSLAVAQSAAPSAPSDVERAVTLASPGVVFIDTSVRIHVRLIYQNANAVSGLGHLDRNYAFDYATGSGFVVTPTGTVVTASHVVEPDRDSMRNYAANRLVLEGFGYDYPNANSSRFGRYTLPVGWQNVLLQQCYKAVACRFTITPIETVFSPVDIAQTQLPKGTPARILTSTGFENTDIAVLQVNGSNMPTVSLGETTADLATGDEVVALGFPGTSRDSLQTGVTQPNKVFGHVSNIRPEGTSNLIEVDANIEPGMSGGPVIDGSGDVIGLISFTLLQSSGESGAKYLRTIDDIKAALAAAGVTPARGPADTAFGDAMDLYWGNHFTAAVPELQKAVDLYPGHPLATEFLAQAQSKAGTAADVPLVEPTPAPTTKGGFPVWVAIAAAGGVVLVLLALFFARRRRKPAAPAAVVAQMAPPVSAIGSPVPQEAASARTVGFQVPQAATATPTPTPNGSEGAAVSTTTATEVRETAHFCSSCGHAVGAEASFCPSCGHEVTA